MYKTVVLSETVTHSLQKFGTTTLALKKKKALPFSLI